MNRPVIRELAGALRALGDRGHALQPATATTAELDEIAGDLQTARRLLTDTERPAPTTDCAQHPHGPVEPGTATDCLLCGIRRGRGRNALKALQGARCA